MSNEDLPVLTGESLDEDSELSLEQLCQACAQQAAGVIAMVEEGILEPTGNNPSHWCFSVTSIRRVRTVIRLQREFEVNLAGAALALALLDRTERLRARLRRLEG